MQRRSDDAGETVPDGALAVATSVGSETTEVAEQSSARTAREALAPSRHRTGPRQFLHEVNVEMRKVAWPTAAETLNYSTVVFVTLAVLMALIFGLDIGFQHAANLIFNP